MAEENKYPLDYERRFGGVAKLYTKDGAERLKNAHVCVVGLGGVGLGGRSFSAHSCRPHHAGGLR